MILTSPEGKKSRVGIILVQSNPLDVVKSIELSRAGYRKMVENSIWATGYNLIALPLAAGLLAPWGVLLPSGRRVVAEWLLGNGDGGSLSPYGDVRWLYSPRPGRPDPARNRTCAPERLFAGCRRGLANTSLTAAPLSCSIQVRNQRMKEAPRAWCQDSGG